MGRGDSRGVILLHIAATFFSLKSGQSVLRGLRARCLIVKIRCLQLSAIFFSLSFARPVSLPPSNKNLSYYLSSREFLMGRRNDDLFVPREKTGLIKEAPRGIVKKISHCLFLYNRTKASLSTSRGSVKHLSKTV